ncbi:hypothetical protein LCGC14_1156980 [marine sediment metagenome]|uniref:Uncharacterized protein n=1 Tax=marine sediment metagenome TaxID=412755 RepID=A0A0F9MGW5_9ZZZZ
MPDSWVILYPVAVYFVGLFMGRWIWKSNDGA